MTTTWFFIVCEIAVISYAMVAGLFLTFSDFIMRSLNSAPPSAGIEVMQNINRDIFKSLTIFLLWGMVLLSIFIGVYAILYISGFASLLLTTGSVAYIVGVLVVSYTANIPMNDHLKNMVAQDPQAAKYWSEVYVPKWSAWNYLRAIGSGAAAVCTLAACISLATASAVTG